MNSQICQYCGKHYSNPRNKFFCSRACSNKSRTFPLSKICPECNKNFYKRANKNSPCFRGNKYCSPECRYKAQSKLQKKAPNANCEYCDTPFRARPSMVAKGLDRFCSRICADKARTKWPKTSTCKTCGKQFQYNPGHSGIFCSWECLINWHESQAIYVKCQQCGKNFRVLACEQRKGGRKYCSIECFRAAYIGDKTFLWKDGRSFEPYPIKFNNYLKESIRRRDHYICQICGKTQEENGRALDIHHIDYDKTNIDPSNLSSLCWSCNARANSNREYWISYFNDLQTIPTNED